VPTPAGDYAGTIRAVAAVVEELERAADAADTIGLPDRNSFSTENQVCIAVRVSRA